MPDPAAPLYGVLIVLLVVVMLWFTLGTQRNVSRGNRLLGWLQGGLGALGPRTTLRWLGSSVAELRITEPRHPYREAIVLVVLEPRDLGALWAFARRRGRRDFLVLRLNLTRAPRVSVDLVHPDAWMADTRRADTPEPELRHDWTDASGSRVRVQTDPAVDLQPLEAAWNRLASDSGGAWRISVRPAVPHLEVHLLPPADHERASARRLLDEVGALARSLSVPE